jgi:hypothetical protein
LLRTDDRALLVDLLTPPAPGYRLERAVGTTFTLHLESLLRIPLAVVGAEWNTGADPLGVMEAVRSTAGRIDLFCQAGMVTVPQKASALLAFLEPMVHQVRRPVPGHLFHPKVWLVAYTKPESERRFRFLCGSRNLTPDRTWDAVVALDGVEGTEPRSQNEPLAGFLASLSARVPAGVEAARAQAVSDLAHAVRAAVWEAPGGLDEATDWLRFHWLERGRPMPDLIDGAARRVVISPFLNSAGLSLIAPQGDLTVISRAESFAALGEEGIQELRVDRGATLLELDDGAALPRNDEDLDLRWSLRGLHAKVVVAERSRQAHVLIGSPNATDAAFGGNTEFACEVVGPARRFGASALLEDVEGGLLQALVPFAGEAAPEPDEPTLQEQLEQALVDLAALSFEAEAQCTATAQWQQRLRSLEAVPLSFPGDASLTARLLTTATPLAPEPDRPLDLTWVGLDVEDLTPFVALELRAGTASAPVMASCVVLASLSGAPEDRLDRLIARFVSSPEAFLRFVLLLLQLATGEETDLGVVLNEGAVHGLSYFSASSAGVLEAVASALADNPGALDDLSRLVDRLRRTEEGRKVLPEGWEELWSAVEEARSLLEGARR